MYPGYCSANSPITGWTASDLTAVGLNPAGGNFFANNGATPDGANVAFIETTGNTNWLATSISNLTAGTMYRVSCRVNARADGIPPTVWLYLNGEPTYANTVLPVDAAGNSSAPYNYAYGVFMATSTEAPLVVYSTSTNEGALLLDDFQVTALGSDYFSVTAWQDDASAGVAATNTLWAYAFAAPTNYLIHGVTFTGLSGGDPNASGVFAVASDFETFAGETPDNLSGAGSRDLAANFVYGGNPAVVTVSNLNAGTAYRLMCYGVAYDQPGNRYATFAGAGDSLYLDEDTYGEGNGVRVDYYFTATNANATLAITPATVSDTFHLHGLALDKLASPPVIAGQPTNLSALAGTETELLAVVGGSAPLVYQWYELGQGPVMGGTNAALAWSNLAISNAGTYYVVVTNSLGMATSSNATLTVLYPPVITSEPTNLTVLAGATAQLSAAAIGTAPVSYQWYELGQGAVAGATNAILAWSSAAISNGGTYYVTITNFYGATNSTSATVTVLHAPVITTQPTNIAAPVGMAAQLSVTVDGTVPVFYQWYQASQGAVAGATNAILAWSNLVLSNAATYYVVVTNTYGATTSSNAVLTVQYPPVITSQPTNLTAKAGSTTQLSVTVNGTAPLGYQWYEQGVGAIAGATNAALVWSSLAISNAGTYYVVVTNFLGSTNSSSAQLTVVYPPIITSEPTNFTALTGAAGQLSVAAESPLPVHYQWYKQGSGAVSGATNTILGWTNLAVANEGTYYVVATNTVGPTTSSNAVVTVLHAPVFTAQPVNIVTNAGGTAQLKATVDATAPVYYQWYQVGQGAVTNATNTILSWTSMAVSNAGTYNLVATNIYGSATSSNATVTVLLIPVITKQPTNVAAFLGATGQLSVTSASQAPMTYQWYRWGPAVVTGATNAALVWANLAAANAGTYSVVVSNNYGTMTSRWASIDPVICRSSPLTNSIWSTFQDPGLSFTTPGSAVSAGSQFSLALLADDTVVAWGSNRLGILSVPATVTNVVAVSAGLMHALVVRANGSVVAWGANGAGQATVPAAATNAVAVAGGALHSLVLRADGSVLAWGANTNAAGTSTGQTNVPAAATNVTAIAAGYYHNLALRADGSVVAWGDNSAGESTVPAAATNVVAVAAGDDYSLALTAGGSVIVWGDTQSGTLNVPTAATNVAAIAAGGSFCAALQADGTVLEWGSNAATASIPATITNVAAFAAGTTHALVLESNGMVAGWGDDSAGALNLPSFTVTNLAASGTVSNLVGAYTLTYRFTNAWKMVLATNRLVHEADYPALLHDILPLTGADEAGSQVTFTTSVQGDNLVLQWYKNAGSGVTAIVDATNGSLTLSNLAVTDTGSYWLVATNPGGAVISSTNSFTVNPAAVAAAGMIIEEAYQTAAGAFTPTWTVASNSVIAGQVPNTNAGMFTLQGAGGAAVLTDGQIGPIGGSKNGSLATGGINGGTTLVYFLTNGASSYQLTNIVVYGGWSDDSRDEQAYTIYYATADAPTNFTELTAVDYLPPADNATPIATRVTIAPSGAAMLASQVAAMRFDFTTPNNGGENGYEGYAEIDLFGVANPAATRPVVTGSHYDPANGVFSFSLTGTSGQTVVVETCTNLVAAVWVLVQTNTLATSGVVFSATNQPANPARFFRVRTQ